MYTKIGWYNPFEMTSIMHTTHFGNEIHSSFVGNLSLKALDSVTVHRALKNYLTLSTSRSETDSTS